jgi:3-oxoacyl-[acyl-carrier protein] reductase
MELGLRGKVAIVSGASKGIGRAIAAELAAEGASITICARGLANLEKAAREIREEVEVLAVQADVTKVQDIERVVDETVRARGRVDILINNAGGDSGLGSSIDTTDAQWHHALELNLLSAVKFTRAVVPLMRKQGGGRIINISSVSGHTMLGGIVDYESSKAALLAFSKTTSIDLAADNILVNSVCPALIRTPLWDSVADLMIPSRGNTREEVTQNYANQHLTLKRFGEPEEVAGLVVFLASDRASYITGVAYDVDGGFTKTI